MLNKRYRLNKGFDEVYKRGYKVSGKYGMLRGIYDEKISFPQFGIVVPKKVGKAHQRNKLKRRVRGIIQRLLNQGYFENLKIKILYIAFPESPDYPSLKKECLEQFCEILEKMKK